MFYQSEVDKIEVGDYITFKVTTRGSGRRKVRRQVNGKATFDAHGADMDYPTVRYDGYSEFVAGYSPTDTLLIVERGDEVIIDNR